MTTQLEPHIYTRTTCFHVVGNCSILISILESHSVQMKDDKRNEWQAAGISRVRESLLTFPTCTTDKSFLWEEVMGKYYTMRLI